MACGLVLLPELGFPSRNNPSVSLTVEIILPQASEYKYSKPKYNIPFKFLTNALMDVDASVTRWRIVRTSLSLVNSL